MSLVHLLVIDRQRSVINSTARVGRAYSAYGWGSFQSGPHSAFCGEPRDGLTGCYHLGSGYRQYNPLIMRFHSPDALSPFDEGGLNAYMYCDADPVNRCDPSGAIWLPTVQSALTLALHVTSPVALAIGPTPKGSLAVNATRMALLGSPTAALGAGLGLAGVAAAPYFSAAGTGLLVMGAGTRLSKAVWDSRQTLWNNVKKNFRSNLRAIFKGRVEKKYKSSPPSSPKKQSGTGGNQPVFTIDVEGAGYQKSPSTPMNTDVQGGMGRIVEGIRRT